MAKDALDTTSKRPLPSSRFPVLVDNTPVKSEPLEEKKNEVKQLKRKKQVSAKAQAAAVEAQDVSTSPPHPKKEVKRARAQETTPPAVEAQDTVSTFPPHPKKEVKRARAQEITPRNHKLTKNDRSHSAGFSQTVIKNGKTVMPPAPGQKLQIKQEHIDHTFTWYKATMEKTRQETFDKHTATMY
jgi:hypothetical protein